MCCDTESGRGNWGTPAIASRRINVTNNMRVHSSDSSLRFTRLLHLCDSTTASGFIILTDVGEGGGRQKSQEVLLDE